MHLRMLIGTLAGFASVGFVAWRVHDMHHRIICNIGIVADPSASHPGGCSSLQGIAEEILGGHPMPAGSWLAVLAIGEESTSNEPRLLARYPIPVNRRIMEGPTTSLKRKQQILDDLKLRCGELHPTMVSPIFQGVSQGLAELRGLGCANDSDCKLWVDSDLEENTVSTIKTVLEHPDSKRLGLPTRLENEGIHVAFCGLAVTAGRIIGPSGREVRKARPRDPSHDDNLRRTWAALFTKPELVTFDPYCPGPRPSGETGSPKY